MATVTLSNSATVDGRRFDYAETVTTAQGAFAEPSSTTMGTAKSGTLSTRTDANDGTLTMTAGHGFTDGQIIDIYFSGGVAYKATIGTVATNSVPFTGAEGSDGTGGDPLPAQGTAITAMVVRSEDLSVDASECDFVGATADNAAPFVVRFVNGSSTDVGVIVVKTAAQKSKVWTANLGGSCPITGDCVSVRLSHGDTTARGVTVWAGAN
jgi:hypothetical protein